MFRAILSVAALAVDAYLCLLTIQIALLAIAVSLIVRSDRLYARSAAALDRIRARRPLAVALAILAGPALLILRVGLVLALKAGRPARARA